MAAVPPLEITNSQVSAATENDLVPRSIDDLKSCQNLSNNEPRKEEELAGSDSETESVFHHKSLRFRNKSYPLKYNDRSFIRPSRRLPEENFQFGHQTNSHLPTAANGDRARMNYRFSEIDTRQSTTTDSSAVSNSFHSVPDLTRYQVFPSEIRSPSKFLVSTNREYVTFPLRPKEVMATLSIEPDFSKSDLELTVVKSVEEIKSPSDNVIVILDPEEKKALIPILMYDQGINILLYSREISVVEMTKEEQMKHFVDLFTHLKKAKEHALAAWQILLGGVQYSDVCPSDDTSCRFRSNKRFKKVIHELERVMTVLQVRRPDESVGKLVKQRAKSDVRIIQLKRSRSARSISRFSLITLLNMDSVMPNILLNMAVQLVVIVLDSLKDFHKSSLTTKFHVSGSVLFDLKAIVHRFCKEIQTILEYFDRSMTRCRSKRSEVYLVNHAIPSQRPSIVLFKSGLRTKSLTDLDSLKAPVQKPVLRRCKSVTLCDLTTWNPHCPQPTLEPQEEQTVLLHGPPPSFEMLPMIENQFLERIIDAVRKMLFREPACVSLGDVIRVRMLYHEMGFVEACKDFVSELLDTVAASVHTSTVELFGLKNERRLKMNIADEMGILLARLFDELATDIAVCKRPERSMLLPLPLGTISVLQKYLHDAVIRNYSPKSLPGSIVSLRSEEMMLAALLQDYCDDRKVPFPLIHHIHANMQAFLWKILTAQRILRELEIKFSKYVIEDIMLRGVYDTIREVETIHQIGESKEELLHALSKVDKLYYIEPLANAENHTLIHPDTGEEAVAERVTETDLFTVDQLRDIHSEMCGSVVPVTPPWCRSVALTAIGLEIATATVFAVSNGLGDTPTQGLAMVTTLAVALILDAVVFQPLKCAFLAHWNAHRKRKLRNRHASSELNTTLITPI